MDTPVIVGAAAVPVQALTAVAGGLVEGSNGETVSAPETPKAIPEAWVGVAPKVTVIASAVTADEAMPYHSYFVERYVPEQDERMLLADVCQVILDRVSDTELTPIVVFDLKV